VGTFNLNYKMGNITKQQAEVLWNWFQAYLNENPTTDADIEVMQEIGIHLPDQIEEIRQIWCNHETDKPAERNIV